MSHAVFETYLYFKKSSLIYPNFRSQLGVLCVRGFQVAEEVKKKNLPAMQEMQELGV